MELKNKHEITWREYQEYIKSKNKGKSALPLFLKVILYVLISLGTILIVFIFVNTSKCPTSHESIQQSAEELGFKQIKPYLTHLDPSDIDNRNFWILNVSGRDLKVETFIDTDLQSYIKRLIKRSRTLSCAVVVIEPETGRVLSMVDWGRQGKGNLCLRSEFPAASLFKIVIASAVVEERSFAPDKRLYFNGRAHTLYRSQLKNNIKRRYSNRTTLRMAFARSINPVFGKIGIYDLGRETIERYAERFLFNKEIQFDIPCKRSVLVVPEDDFGIAEIASGFNKRTLISPLHAVLLGSTIAKDGIMMRPILIKRIIDNNGKELYRGRPSILARVISKKTSGKIKELMEATVRYGTCRNSFIKLMRKRRFKGFSFGAKTGSVNDKYDRVKYDWLVSYAIPPDGKNGISMGILAIHGERLGIRSREIGRYIIQYFFSRKRDSLLKNTS